jgi:hypothetical protein
MSTTLLPPTYYVVKPRGGGALQFPTVAEAALAIITLAPTPVRLSVMNGIRARALTDAERHELGQHVRAHRLRARADSSEPPPAVRAAARG